ncbi:MAG: lysophospholipid acyltransferase family protein [Candidatus Goldbacteria bacterium]|nr:lysophospholipid acyltransferase family protein [Candidatus Goldiibacteriota bacterium]
MYFFLKFSEFILKKIPRKAGYFIFEFFSVILFYFSNKKRQTLKKNLSVISDVADVNKSAFCVYKNYSRYYFDLFTKKEKLLKNIVSCDEFENRISKVKETAKQHPLIIFSMHLGNWDLGGCYLSYLIPDKINVVVEKLSSDLYKWFKETRAQWQMKIIEAGNVKSMIKVLKNNECLVILSDRDLKKNGYQIEFFGRKAYIPSGPAKLALLTHSYLILGAMLRDKNNPEKFIPFIDDEFLNMEDLPKTEENCINLTREMLKRMEKLVAQYPEQWCMLQQIFVDQ